MDPGQFQLGQTKLFIKDPASVRCSSVQGGLQPTPQIACMPGPGDYKL